MKKNDQIVISKSKLLKVIGITLGVVAFIGICFAISSSNSEVYNTSSNSDETEEDVYDVAVKDAANVSEEERAEANQIDIDTYIKLYNSSKKSLVLFSRPTCQYCQIATPILENIIYKYDVDINYLNTDELDEDSNATLVTSNEYFEDGYGTPLLLVVGNGEIIDQIEGLTTKDNYIDFFKKYGFME